MTDFLSLAAEVGFSHCAPLCMAAAVPRREVRGMCAADRCGKWGRCWSCPPACGTLEQAGHKCCYIPVGASTALGAVGYVSGAREIAVQAMAAGVRLGHIVSATGSGGTAAGKGTKRRIWTKNT